MMKTVGIAMVVLGGACWVLGAGTAEPSTQPTTRPSTQPAKELALDLGGGVAMKLVLIPAGKFLMGSPSGESGRYDREGPQRGVTLSKPFYMGVYEVTQEQYQAMMGNNPSKFKGSTQPVEQVSWDDAVDFCQRLSQKTGGTVRLPTEAEWEYACRADSRTRFCFGDSDNRLGHYGWYGSNSGSRTHSVGQKKPNDWSLYDMHGNVYEWCADRYGDSYANANAVDPHGPDSGTDRVLRGGCWFYFPQLCRSAYRAKAGPGHRGYGFGFRVVLDLK